MNPMKKIVAVGHSHLEKADITDKLSTKLKEEQHLDADHESPLSKYYIITVNSTHHSWVLNFEGQECH